MPVPRLMAKANTLVFNPPPTDAEATMAGILRSPDSQIDMDTAHTQRTDSVVACTPPLQGSDVTRGFNLSILVSGIRCTLSYVVLPFLIPFLGLAPGVGPASGLAIGIVAIAANAWSIRRFWRARHPWRGAATAVHLGVIGLLVVLVAIDIGNLTTTV